MIPIPMSFRFLFRFGLKHLTVACHVVEYYVIFNNTTVVDTEPVIAIKPLKPNMTMENPPFEDVFSIKDGDVPMSC